MKNSVIAEELFPQMHTDKAPHENTESGTIRHQPPCCTSMLNPISLAQAV